MNFNDKRVRKTKKALQSALIQLLGEKELRQITVKDLTNTADVHRATFYTHYTDAYDLYHKMESAFLSGLAERMTNDPTHTYNTVYMSLVEYIKDNIDLSKMFLCSSENAQFRKRVSELLKECYLKIWMFEERKSEITEDIEYIIEYHIQGSIAIITKWIGSGCAIPVGKVSKLIQKLDYNVDRFL